MTATVLLKDIVDALEMQFDESSSFLDLNTGKAETVSHDLLHRAEESVGAFLVARVRAGARRYAIGCSELARADEKTHNPRSIALFGASAGAAGAGYKAETETFG